MDLAKRDLSQLKAELKILIIESLKLEDLGPDDLDDHEPLFGEGLGLDSIDALELTVALDKTYGVAVPDAKVGQKVFTSVQTLAEYVHSQRNPQ